MSLRKGVINFVDGHDKKMATVQTEGLAGEVASNVEFYQPFGFSSHPMPCNEDGKGAEVILANLGSTSQRTVIGCSDRRFRPVVSVPGDVMLHGVHDTQTATHDGATQRLTFTDDSDPDNYRLIAKVGPCKLEMRSDGTITVANANASLVVAPDGTITTTAPTLNISANVNITGNLNVSGNVTNAGKNISKSHTHSGVQPGSGTSGQVS